MIANINGTDFIQMFPMEDWDCPEAFKFAGVRGLEPMLAKELDTEESQDEALNSIEYMIEEKFDGTRALVHFFKSCDGVNNEFKEEYIVPQFLPLARILLNLPQTNKRYLRDLRIRLENEKAKPLDVMNVVRDYLIQIGEFEYLDTDGTEVSVTFDGQYVKYTATVSGVHGSFSNTYRELVLVLDTLVLVNKCYSVGDSGYCRVFSRRLSKKTNFYAENTDSLPHIRDLDFPELNGTVLDGEMFIDGLPFKEVSSTMNCLWDEAIKRQMDKGFISFHTFDILFYKGIDLRRMPLIKRKKFLKIVVDHINSPYVQFVEYQLCGHLVSTEAYEKDHGTAGDLWCNLNTIGKGGAYPTFMYDYDTYGGKVLSPRGFYEYIVATGGEGVIVKPIDGRYNHKRGWEYSKIKAFLTREMILIKFDEPTKEYTGKAPKEWEYYEDGIPVTKYYAQGLVGNMVLGVLITEEELSKIPKTKRGQLYHPAFVGIHNMDEKYVMEVCECSGMNDGEREYFTKHRNEMIGRVIEVKANGIMTDSGRLRHPRYLRIRPDKAREQCTWVDHIGG